MNGVLVIDYKPFDFLFMDGMNIFLIFFFGVELSCNRPVRLAYQLPANSTFLSEQTSHQQPASVTFLSEQISTSTAICIDPYRG
jgi:hypothetical protein